MMDDRLGPAFSVLFLSKDMLEDVSNLVLSAMVTGELTLKVARHIEATVLMALTDLAAWQEAAPQWLIQFYSLGGSEPAALRAQIDHAGLAENRDLFRERIYESLVAAPSSSPFWTLYSFLCTAVGLATM